MALYYLKESDDGGTPVAPTALVKPKDISSPILSIAFGSIILLATFVQLLGLTWLFEEHLFLSLPPSILPNYPPTPAIRPLELPATNGTLASLDVAMALRGLGKLHPARILIAGKVTSDKESEQLLLGVLNTIRAEGIDIIQVQESSPAAEYHSVALCRYDLPYWISAPLRLESVPGKISNKGQYCFLPASADPSGALQLFAETNHGEIVGSIWWEIFREISRLGSMKPSPDISPVWLLGGRLLVFPERSPVFLTDRGSLPLKESRSDKVKSPTPRLENFLLGIEQKERGEKSAPFDMQWNDGLVVLCQESDLSSLETLQQLESQRAWRHLSWITQIVIGVGCIILLLIGVRSRRTPSLILAVLVTVTTLAATMLALRHGILIPWLAPAFVTLGLLVREALPRFPRSPR